MKLKNLRFCLTIILLTASLIPIVAAPNIQPEPIDSNDDAFITGAGNYFGDTPYLFLRDEVTNLVLGTRFRNVNIAQGEKINNATLFVRSVYTYAAAGDIRVTITGDDIDDSRAFNDSGSFSRTYTSAYVVWNISEVNGDSWHNVSVTEIVQEIIDRVGWQSGNDLSLVFFTDKGTPRREFASVDGNPAFTAYIDINYGVPPPPDEVADIQDNSTAPYNDTTVYVWEYNDTYRGIDIYIVTEIISEWLNFSTFTVTGAHSAKISGLNDTYFHVQQMEGDSQVWMQRAFTDDGTGIVRFKFGIEFTDLYAGGGGSAWIGHWGISDTSNTWINDWNNGYAFVARVFDLGDDSHMGTAWDIESNALGDSDVWFYHVNHVESNMPYTLWFDFYLDMNGAFYNVSTYNDFEMTDLNHTRNYAFTDLPPTYSPGAFPYETLVNGWQNLATAMGYTANYLSGLNVEGEEFIFITYPNGTLIDPDPLPDGVDPEDAIDDLLGGAQPEDPEPDEYTVIDKFRWKLLVLCIGMIMMIGSPLAGVIYGADTATWIKLLFVAFFGLGILWQIKFM